MYVKLGTSTTLRLSCTLKTRLKMSIGMRIQIIELKRMEFHHLEVEGAHHKKYANPVAHALPVYNIVTRLQVGIRSSSGLPHGEEQT